MKVHVLFNIFIQLIILIKSFVLYYDIYMFKFLEALFLIEIIFIPSIIEYINKKSMKVIFHYLFTIISFILFIFIIAF